MATAASTRVRQLPRLCSGGRHVRMYACRRRSVSCLRSRLLSTDSLRFTLAPSGSSSSLHADWWNAPTVAAFWNRWNLPVHNWALTTVYAPLKSLGVRRLRLLWTRLVRAYAACPHVCTVKAPQPVLAQRVVRAQMVQQMPQRAQRNSRARHAGVSKQLASIAIFFVSALLHELALSAPLQVRQGWAFVGMLAQVPMVVLTAATTSLLQRWRVHESHIFLSGNAALWVSMCFIGQPMCVVLYIAAFSAKHGV